MNLSPLPIQKFFDNAGAPLNGGKLFTYVAATTTKIATYTDSTGGSPNTNPVVLNYRGEANVWLDPTLTYKFVLAPSTDTDPPTNPIWSVDNIVAGITLASLTQQILGQILYPRTAAEIAASVTPVNYWYPPGHIKRYNAIIDGATDDSAAVRNAFAQASQAGGASVFHPGGTCLIAASITHVVSGNTYPCAVLPGSNTLVYGAGIGVSIFKLKSAAANDTRMFLMDGLSNVSFQDLTIDGNLAGQSVPVTDNGISLLVANNNCTTIRVINCGITGCTQDCISLGYPNGTVATDVLVEGCTFSAFHRGGVTCTDARNVRIDGNHFLDSVAGLLTANDGSNGVWLEPNSGTAPLENISVVGNTFRNTRGGVYAANLNQTDVFSLTVVGNTFDAVTQQALFGSSSWGMLVEGNTFHTCGTSGSPAVSFPVKLDNARWCKVTGNFFRDCVGSAADIEVTNTALYINISQNTFMNSLRGCIKVNSVASASKGRVISNNIIESGGTQTPNTYTGIEVINPNTNPSDDDVITGNIIKTSTAAGLAIGMHTDYMTGGVLKDNLIAGTGTSYSLTNGDPNKGTFTGTLTGCTTSPTGTISYTVDADTNTVTLDFGSGISAVSNTTACTITGLPTALQPLAQQVAFLRAIDNSVNVVGFARIETAGNLITLLATNGSSAGFTAAGTKGMNRCTISYVKN